MYFNFRCFFTGPSAGRLDHHNSLQGPGAAGGSARLCADERQHARGSGLHAAVTLPPSRLHWTGYGEAPQRAGWAGDSIRLPLSLNWIWYHHVIILIFSEDLKKSQIDIRLALVLCVQVWCLQLCWLLPKSKNRRICSVSLPHHFHYIDTRYQNMDWPTNSCSLFHFTQQAR